VVPEGCVVDRREAEPIPAVDPRGAALHTPPCLFQINTSLIAGKDVVDDFEIAVIGSHVEKGAAVVVEQSFDIFEVLIDEFLGDVVLLSVADAFEQPPLHSNQIMNCSREMQRIEST
jgi:hypothetical protein